MDGQQSPRLLRSGKSIDFVPITDSNVLCNNNPDNSNSLSPPVSYLHQTSEVSKAVVPSPEIGMHERRLRELRDELRETELRLSALSFKQQPQRTTPNHTFSDGKYRSVALDMQSVMHDDQPACAIPRAFEKPSTDCNYDRLRTSPQGGLPNIEIEKFDGTPVKFWAFRKTFELCVANKLNDDSQRFVYLLNHCVGEAKETIQHCIFLPPDQGYSTAMKLLQAEFGHADGLTDSLINELINGPVISYEDVAALRQLIRKMKNCHLALSQINGTSELDCATNLKRIVYRLPKILQHKWAEAAQDILNCNRRPSFSELLLFLERRAQIMNNCYGKIANSGKSVIPRINERTRINLTNASATRCQACSQDHALSICPKFNGMDSVGRKNLVMLSKSCFNCLKRNHRAIDCSKPPQCTLNGCGRKHHPTLHSNSPASAEINTTKVTSSRTLLAFVPVCLKGPRCSIDAYGFLDNGSDSTLILKDVAEQLGLVGERLHLEVQSINGTSIKPSMALRCSVASIDGENDVSIDRAYTVKHLPIAHAHVPSDASVKEYPHLRDLPLTRLQNQGVAILIGADVPEAHWALDKRIGSKKQPFALKTVFGWTILGPMNNSVRNTVAVNSIETQPTTEFQLLNLFSSDFRDKFDNPDKAMSKEDKNVFHMAQRSISFRNGHYYLRLPWKIDWADMPDNRLMAVKRLHCLRKRLLKSPELREKYTDIFAAYLSKGYISRVNSSQNAVLRYVPHHPVINPRKPGKVRIVFDFAATSGGMSINDCLYSGPDITNELNGVLLRFRLYPVALAADIEEMFLQVRVAEKDKPALSFLWYPDGNLESEPDVYTLNVHPFGATSSPFNATFALRQTAVDNADKFDNLTLETLRTNFYVDDCLVSVKTAAIASELVEQLRHLTSMGGFRLHKWVSNSEQALVNTPDNECATGSVSLNPKDPLMHKTLGLYWCVKSDCFRFKLDLPERPATKRGILSCAASLYDPLGFVAPLSLQPKRIVQELCQHKCGWDDLVPSSIASIWDKWKADVKFVESLRIPRCLFPVSHNTVSTSLHLFSDASEIGYGSVAYLRNEDSCQKVLCSFLMGKSRVAPLKSVTIPRLELQAAVMSIKLMCYILKELNLNIKAIYLWTDSTIVLGYIKNTSTRFKTFVANRISFIQEHTAVEQWRFVPTDQNPADIASRGLKNKNMDSLNKWLDGPPFLLLNRDCWPNFPESIVDTAYSADDETKKAVIFQAQTKTEPFDRLLSYFSSWNMIRRAVAWFGRYLNFTRSKNSTANFARGPLTLDEIHHAEFVIFKYVQSRSFPDWVDSENNHGSQFGARNLAISKLCPIIDQNGLLRVGGRLRNCSTSSQTKHPIVLPSDHAVSSAIALHYHLTEGHMGLAHVVASIRQDYWIMRCAAIVKRVIHRCIGCKMRSSIPGHQMMSDLPLVRVQPDVPFAATGVDYFGPFSVREGRKHLKMYGCIFSCLKTRAVHIEVAHTLSTDSFLMALARFVNRRGRPSELFSDQGTNFVGAEHELRQCRTIFRDDRLKGALVDKNIKWHFNPPYSSHRGGIWERMIRSIRRILSAVSREQVLTQESLTTYLTEVERILNDRPLVPVYDDPSSLDVLTPNHVLRMRDCPNSSVAHADLRDRYSRLWRQAQLLADTFWRRWIKEYLPTLQRREKWLAEGRNFTVGDLVLLMETNQPRGLWPKGVVVNASPSEDNRIRTIQIRTPTGVIHRDVRKVCLLEGVEVRGERL